VGQVIGTDTIKGCRGEGLILTWDMGGTCSFEKESGG